MPKIRGDIYHVTGKNQLAVHFVLQSLYSHKNCTQNSRIYPYVFLQGNAWNELNDDTKIHFFPLQSKFLKLWKFPWLCDCTIFLYKHTFEDLIVTISRFSSRNPKWIMVKNSCFGYSFSIFLPNFLPFRRCGDPEKWSAKFSATSSIFDFERIKIFHQKCVKGTKDSGFREPLCSCWNARPVLAFSLSIQHGCVWSKLLLAILVVYSETKERLTEKTRVETQAPQSDLWVLKRINLKSQLHSHNQLTTWL